MADDNRTDRPAGDGAALFARDLAARRARAGAR